MMARAFLILLLLGVSGCATSRLEQLDATLRAYERAVRWGDFQTALALANQSGAPPPDFRRLQNVRVTSYDKLGNPQGNADSTQVVQLVEIRYVNVGNMSERVLTDRQEWVYSPSDDRWKLLSPFPIFR